MRLSCRSGEVPCNPIADRRDSGSDTKISRAEPADDAAVFEAIDCLTQRRVTAQGRCASGSEAKFQRNDDEVDEDGAVARGQPPAEVSRQQDRSRSDVGSVDEFKVRVGEREP